MSSSPREQGHPGVVFPAKERAQPKNAFGLQMSERLAPLPTIARGELRCVNDSHPTDGRRKRARNGGSTISGTTETDCREQSHGRSTTRRDPSRLGPATSVNARVSSFPPACFFLPSSFLPLFPLISCHNVLLPHSPSGTQVGSSKCSVGFSPYTDTQYRAPSRGGYRLGRGCRHNRTPSSFANCLSSQSLLSRRTSLKPQREVCIPSFPPLFGFAVRRCRPNHVPADLRARSSVR